ncbi:MAG: YggS family pyridoxal phosphate-dependent enzyme [Chloroflexi bacterium]|nr:YggS family pyridoxal phosphate-dependent enzyme [Chloroflexota bacterium]
MSQIAQNLERVNIRIAEAALRAKRDPSEITLVAVSKTFPAADVTSAIFAGQRHFGENRVEEALPKIAAVNASLANVWLAAPPVQWHLIGHVQSRKAKDAANGDFALIHSVDSLKLAQKLASAKQTAGNLSPQPILLQCNVSGEASKEGFDLAGWEYAPAKLDLFLSSVVQITALPTLKIGGLMTIAPIVAEPAQARPVFASLRLLRDKLQHALPNVDWSHLSMGMSDDLEPAIAEGATIIRVGRAIFGGRTNNG